MLGVVALLGFILITVVLVTTFLKNPLTVQAVGSTYYVSPKGKDTNMCTEKQPCREIRKALTLVKAGDIVFVTNGKYKGFDLKSINGTTDAPITIKAQGTDVEIMTTTDRVDNRDTVHIGPSSSYIVLDGIRSFNANRAAVRVDASSHITIKNSIFGNNAKWGIFTNHSDDLLIENNETYGSKVEHGIYVSNSGDRPVIRGNRSHDNYICGIHMNGDVSQGGDGIISGAIVENNIVYNNGRGGGAGINMDGTQDTIVRNNILYNNHAGGITMYKIDAAQGPKNNQVYHNTIDMASDGRYDVLVSQSNGSNSIHNNILYTRNKSRGGILYKAMPDVTNTDSAYNIFGGAPYITSDDGATRIRLTDWQAQGRESHSFISEITGLVMQPYNEIINAVNYHLKKGSPAIDAGQLLPNVMVDFENNKRPIGTSSDIGADEFN